MINEQRIIELYDLEKDKLEMDNIIDTHIDIVRKIEKEIKSWQKEKLEQRSKLGFRRSLVAIDQTQIKQLRALGYLQ